MSIAVAILVVLAIVGFVVYVLASRTERPVDPDAQAPVERGPAPRPNDASLPGSGPDRRAHGKQ